MIISFFFSLSIIHPFLKFFSSYAHCRNLSVFRIYLFFFVSKLGAPFLSLINDQNLLLIDRPVSSQVPLVFRFSPRKVLIECLVYESHAFLSEPGEPSSFGAIPRCYTLLIEWCCLAFQRNQTLGHQRLVFRSSDALYVYTFSSCCFLGVLFALSLAEKRGVVDDCFCLFTKHCDGGNDDGRVAFQSQASAWPAPC